MCIVGFLLCDLIVSSLYDDREVAKISCAPDAILFCYGCRLSTVPSFEQAKHSCWEVDAASSTVNIRDARLVVNSAVVICNCADVC
jgi:hypothetical protein